MTSALQRRTVLAAAIAAIALAGAACARANPDLVDLKVVDRATGEELPTWRHHGRLFVAGEPGALYSLRVTNHTDGRVMLVMSVDGVNIVTGQTASYSQNGYVLGPHDAYDVTGWRKSTSEVAAFAFAPLPQSYAAQTGRPTEVGIIGMAVFTERAPVAVPVPAPIPYAADASRYAPASKARAYPPPPPPSAPVVMSRSMAAPSAPAPSLEADNAPVRRDEEKLGTAHGAREYSWVNMTDFERATPYPQSVRRIEYDTYARLAAAGVIPTLREHRPQPFPLNGDGAGFVPDPPGAL